MKKICFIGLLIISIIMSLFSIYTVFNIGLIPNIILYILIGVLVLLNVIEGFMIFRKNKILKVIGIVLAIIVIIFNGIAIFYVSTTNKFLDNAFSGKTIEVTTYNLVSLKSNDYSSEKLKELENLSTGVYKNSNSNIKDAYEILDEDYSLDYKDYEKINDMFNELIENKINLVLIESTSYNIIRDFDSNINDKCEIIKTIDIKEEKKAKEIKDSAFNIYIVGTDFAGLNDFNMLVTVNTKLKKVLLTSIPRDYHIEVAGMNGITDNITYLSALGVDTSVNSLSNFFQTSIDYYLKINTTSLVKLVDSVGGINFCSDYEYYTTHALVLDTYNDAGEKLYVRKGCQELNGIQTLTVARERKNIPGGDIARQDNCRKIIIAIFHKLESLNTVTNYDKILESIKDSYETTIPRSKIEELGKDLLKSNSKWQINEQAVSGEAVIGSVHLGSVRDYIMVPDMNSVSLAIDNIHKLGK